MSSESPSWLATGNAAPAPASSSLEISSPTTPTGGAVSSAEDDKDLPGVILMMRLTNMGMAAGIIAAAVRAYGLGCYIYYLSLWFADSLF